MPGRSARTAVTTLCHPVVLAALVTLAGAAKPVVVDDTAYLVFARHIASDPTHPYGFEHFWYSEPEPAMEILAPPVVPYWLAAGIRLFGDDIVLLKLWLFPFPLAFALAARSLLARFARGSERVLLPAIVLGPGVLPFLNVMLDIPALALEFAAVALFAGSLDRGGDRRKVILAGLCAGLACQTKYSVLGVVPAILLYGLVYRSLLTAVVCVLTGTGLFAGWEYFVVAGSGTSHFLHHLNAEVHSAADVGSETVGGLEKMNLMFQRKFNLVMPLLSHLGATAWWVGLLGVRSLGVGKRAVLTVVGLAGAAGAAVAVLPGARVVIVPGPHPAGDQLTVNGVLFTLLGSFTVVAAGFVAFALLVRSRRVCIGVFATGQQIGNRFAGAGRPAGRTRGFFRNDRAALFLAGWLIIEIAASLAMTPFPAARRGLGVSFVLAVLVARLWARMRRVERLSGTGWVVGAAVVSGILLAALDTFEALPERELPRAAAAMARDRGWTGTGYFIGHWGFQYYCEREGMKPLIPGRTALQPGDWILEPIYPDDFGFYRPAGWVVPAMRRGVAIEFEAELIWDDVISAQTIPNLYGGRTPVVTRKHPRLRVAVFRVVRPVKA